MISVPSSNATLVGGICSREIRYVGLESLMQLEFSPSDHCSTRLNVCSRSLLTVDVRSVHLFEEVLEGEQPVVECHYPSRRCRSEALVEYVSKVECEAIEDL